MSLKNIFLLATCFWLNGLNLWANEEESVILQPSEEPKKLEAESGPDDQEEKPAAPIDIKKMKAGIKALFAQDVVIFSDNNVGTSFAPGVGAMFEYAWFDFLSIGAQIDTRFNISKEITYFDIDAFAKAPFAIGFTKPIPDFYVIVPLGLSLGVFASDKLKLAKGLNAGIMVGKEFFFAQSYGVLLELGYAYRYLSGETTANRNFSLHFHELMANLGFTFRF